MKHIISILSLGCIIAATGNAGAKTQRLTSPDGRTVVSVSDSPDVTYSIARDGNAVLEMSPLAMTVGADTWGVDEKRPGVSRRSVDSVVEFLVKRKYASTPDRYNELTLRYKDHDIQFRAYDNGVAYRFVSTTDNPSPVNSETVAYRFGDDPETITLLTNELQNWYEHDYTFKALSELPVDSFSVTPVMVDRAGVKMLIADANLYDYPGMYLKPVDRGFDAVFANYPDKEVQADGDNKIYADTRHPYLIPRAGKRTFPWRATGLFDNAGDIVTDELVYLLSDGPDAGADFTWVKPGNILWDWWNDRNIYGVDFKSGINTETFMYLVDYAAANGIDNILLDEGWSARNNLLTLADGVDVPAICRHAEEKGVGVMLWAKWPNVLRQMEDAFGLFEEWGVKGVKVDFMDRNDAKMVRFFEDVARCAARHRLMVDFHGSYPNEGMRRRYPNLMTREGVLGLEYNKWSDRATPRHDVIIPYLRMWVGPMDYTPGAMLNAHPETFHANQQEPMSQGTRSHQVAQYVVYESPLQMISDSPSKYDENQGSFGFIKSIPTVWDETVALGGEIGEYIAVARRSGDTWYVGVLNGETPREIVLDMSFLGEGRFKVRSHRDGVNANRQAKDHVISTTVIDGDGGDGMPVALARGGGYVAVIDRAEK